MFLNLAKACVHVKGNDYLCAAFSEIRETFSFIDATLIFDIKGNVCVLKIILLALSCSLL